MVKKFVAIITLFLICQTGVSQKSVNQIFKEFAKAENSTSVNIGKITMSLASVFTETMGVTGIEVFTLDECNQDIKSKFAKAIKELKDPAYETMVNANETNSRTKVLLKIKDETIHELVVATTGDSNVLVRIKGQIKPADVEKVVNKHTNGRE